MRGFVTEVLKECCSVVYSLLYYVNGRCAALQACFLVQHFVLSQK